MKDNLTYRILLNYVIFILNFSNINCYIEEVNDIKLPLDSPDLIWKRNPFTLVDSFNENNEDLFFDRVVFIIAQEYNLTGDGRQRKIITTGVFIDNFTVLTSYNPYRLIFNNNENVLHKLFACYASRRTLDESLNSYLTIRCHKIVCGRPLSIHHTTTWHKDYLYSPLHDLIVLKIEKKIVTLAEEKQKLAGIEKEEDIFVPIGGIVSELATPLDDLGDHVKYVTLGAASFIEIKEFKRLTKVEYFLDVFSTIDCEKWLLRKWGRFICFKTDDSIYGFSSGALLYDVGSSKLFGVGSFTMFRGNNSIVVFTDVRAYQRLIVKHHLGPPFKI